MPVQRNTIGRRNCAARSAGFALLCLAIIGPLAKADETAAAAGLRPALQIQAVTAVELADSRSNHMATVGAQFSLEHSAARIPLSSGLFADLNLSSQDGDPYFQVLGGWTSYSRGRWRLTSSAAHFSSTKADGLWIYMQKLQYELRPGHKIALTAFGRIHGDRSPALRLAYKTQLAGHFAVEISVGIGGNRPFDFGASSSLAWDVY